VAEFVSQGKKWQGIRGYNKINIMQFYNLINKSKKQATERYPGTDNVI
jgi:hypothetical protein